MKGFFKKSTALVLALMMVLSMFAGMTFTATAATDATTGLVYFENIEDNYASTDFGDYKISLNKGNHTDGMWDISATGSLTIGDADHFIDNYVFETDVYFYQVDGKAKIANNNFLEFRTLRGQTYFTQNRLLGGYKFDSAGTTTSGDQFSKVELQSLHKGVGSYSHVYTGDIGASFKNTDPATPIHVRIEVINGITTFAATYNNVTKTYSVIGNKDTDLAGKKGYFEMVLNYQKGDTVCKLDNMKVAFLDTDTSNTGTFSCETVVAPGTADADLNATCTKKINAFGKDVTVAYPAEFVADGYDVNNAGIRKATMKYGTATQAVEIVYATDYLVGSTTTWNPVDLMNYVAEFDYTPYLMNYWTSQTQNSYIRTQIELCPYYNIGEAIRPYYKHPTDSKRVWDGTSIPADGATSWGTATWRIYRRSLAGASATLSNISTPKPVTNTTWKLKDGETDITAHTNGETTNVTCTSMHAVKDANPTVYRIRVEANGDTIKVWIEEKSKFNGTWGAPDYEQTNSDFALATAKVQFGGGKDVVANAWIVNYEDYAGTDAYGKTVLSANAAATYDLASGTFTSVVGTLSQNYYGFKPSAVTQLADYPVYYNGDNTATVVAGGEYLTIPCTVTYPANTPITHEGGRVTSGNKTAEMQIPFEDFSIEYDFTPYFVDYLRNPFVGLYIEGAYSETSNFEFTAFYQGRSTGKNTIDVNGNGTIEDDEKNMAWPQGLWPEVGATDAVYAQGAGESFWRLFGRGTKNGGNTAQLTVSAEHPATNTIYNGDRSAEDATSGYYARAEKVETPTTYKVLLTYVDGKLTIKVKEATDETAWADVAGATFEGDNASIATAPKMYFSAQAGNAAEADVANIVVTNLGTVNHEIVELSASAQAVQAGSLEAEDLPFTATTASGYNIAMIGAAADAISGYNANKAGAQNVTITKNGVSVTKRVIVSETAINVFEDFSTYEAGEKTIKTQDSHNHPVIWNTADSIVQADGSLLVKNSNMLSSNFTSVEGALGMDVLMPSAGNQALTNPNFWVGKFEATNGMIGVGIVSDGTDFYAAIGWKEGQNFGEAKLLTSKKITEVEFDKVFRLEIRIYGNTVKGVIDGKDVISYSLPADHYLMTAYTGTDEALVKGGAKGDLMNKSLRGGVIGAWLAPLSRKVTGQGTTQQDAVIYIDNIVKNNAVVTYTVDGTAVDVTNTLPTKAQAGDQIVVSADINANGVLKANGKDVFLSTNIIDGTFGGDGNDYVFFMPAANVTLTADGEGTTINTVATSIRNDKSAVRFLNRIYLPATETGLSVDGIKEFGVVLLPKDLFDESGDTELTANTARAKTVKAYDSAAEMATLYDITGKYADYAVVVTTSNLDREFVCRAYYVTTDGAVVYGDTVVESINSWLAK